MILPARDEASAVAATIARLPAALMADVIVVDNGSRDATAAVATGAGARVVSQPHRGYGHACWAGVAALRDTDVVVFLDADGTMPPEEIPALIEPIAEGWADIVCGTRQQREPGSMPLHQQVGNRFALLLLHRLYGVRLTDLGPFRAVRVATLRSLQMPPSRFAWIAEMLARAARQKARIVEVPVSYRRRTQGRSKVSGSLRGSLEAGAGIIGALVWGRLRR